MISAGKNVTKIVLIDDHKIVRAGIKSLLESEKEFKITGEYEYAEDFLRIAKKSSADIVITEITLPGLTGLEMIEEVRKIRPDKSFRIIVLTGHDSYLDIYKAFEAGADGYLLKDCNKEELVRAMHVVSGGENYCSRSVSQILIKRRRRDTPEARRMLISAREKEIIELLSSGHSAKEISDKLFVSLKTVDRHRATILHKLKAKNTAEMVRKAFETKIISLI